MARLRPRHSAMLDGTYHPCITSSDAACFPNLSLPPPLSRLPLCIRGHAGKGLAESSVATGPDQNSRVSGRSQTVPSPFLKQEEQKTLKIAVSSRRKGQCQSGKGPRPFSTQAAHWTQGERMGRRDLGQGVAARRGTLSASLTPCLHPSSLQRVSGASFPDPCAPLFLSHRPIVTPPSASVTG